MNGKIVFVLLLLAAFSSALVRPDLRVIGYNITPQLEPGGQVQLELHVQNIRPEECAYRTTVQVSPLYPISVSGPDTRVLGTICNKNQTDVLFQLEADTAATLGNSPVSVTLSYESSYAAAYSGSSTANINVDGSPFLSAQLTGSTPLDVHPSDTATLLLTLVNEGSAKAQNLRATLQSMDGIEVKASSQTQVVSNLASHDTSTLSYALFIPKTVTPGIHTLLLSLAFEDAHGQNQSSSLSVALPVKPQAFFTADVHDGRLFSGVTNTPITVVVLNTGQAPAYKLHLKLVPQFPFSTDGSDQYVAVLAPGESKPVRFSLSVDKQAAIGQYALTLLASYQDEQERPLRENIDVVLVVPQKDVMALLVDFWFVWLIALCVGAFFYQKKIKSQKRKSDGK